MRKTYFLVITACLLVGIGAFYLSETTPEEGKLQNNLSSPHRTQLTAPSPPENLPQSKNISPQTIVPIAGQSSHLNPTNDKTLATALLNDNSTLIEEQELTEVAQKLFTSVDKVFAVGVSTVQLSAVRPNTVINLDLPQIGLVDYLIEDISSQNGITNLSGHINGDSNSIRSIHISWKDNAMFGSISTPHNVLHLATINDKHFLFIANPELTD